ncbi:matrixin family metalloprotease, partial [Actimicrobium sp. CCI2.3]
IDLSTTTLDANKDGKAEKITTDTFNADGSKVDDVKDFTATGTLKDETTTSTNATGTSVIKTVDSNGDGKIDLSTTTLDANKDGKAEKITTDTFNADGSKVDDVKDFTATGTLKDDTITSTNATGTSVIKTVDSNGDGKIDSSTTTLDANKDGKAEKITTDTFNADGSKVDDVKNFNATGTLASDTTVTLGSDGNKTIDYDSDGNGKVDESVKFNVQGVETDIIFFNNSTGFEAEHDEFDSQTGQKIDQLIFNAVGQVTDMISFDASGHITQEDQFDVTTNTESERLVYNAAGQVTDMISFSPSGYATQEDQFDVTTNTESDRLIYNTDGQVTDKISFNTSSGHVTQDDQFDVTTNTESDRLIYNTAGQVTDKISFDTSSGHVTQADQFDITTNTESDRLIYNAAGQETDKISFDTSSGHVTQDDQFDVTTNTESDRLIYNTAGQVTDKISFDTSSGHVTQDDQFDVTTNTESDRLIYNTAGQVTDKISFNTSGHETQDDQFDVTTNTESDRLIFNAAGQETEKISFNTSGQVTLDDHSIYTTTTTTATGSQDTTSTSGISNTNFYSPGSDIPPETSSSGNNGFGAGSAPAGVSDIPSQTSFSGFFGFVANSSTASIVGRDIDSIAQDDLTHADQQGAAAAKKGLVQVQSAIASGASSVLTGSKWDKQVLTWSVASQGGQFSGKMDQVEEAAAQQAFATWGKASGLTFEEVTGSSPADITVGLGEFDTTNTDIIGYTSFNSKAGVMQAGAVVRIEDSSQYALVAGANGQLTYAGTQTAFEQALLHEIGHALGLADNVAADSIECYSLGSSNQTLSQNDVAAIQSLYQGSSTPVVQSNAMNQLIQSMASFAPLSATQTSMLAANQPNLSPPLLAAAH